MNTIVLQDSSKGTVAAIGSVNDSASMTNSIPEIDNSAEADVNKSASSKTLVQHLENSSPVSVNEVLLHSSVSRVVETHGSNVKTITIDASPHIVTTSSSHMQAGSPAMVSGDKSVLKRHLSGGSSNPNLITKVIITRNPSSSQPHAVPIQVTQLPNSMVSSAGTVSIISQTTGSQTPTKTVTISSQGIVSPGKAVIATLPGSPTKVNIPVNKMAITPAKTPTKITMIPVSIAKSPQQRLGVSTGTSGITVVPRTSLSDLASSNASSTPSTSKPATITMSPSKVIIKQAPNKQGHVKTQAQIAPAAQGPITLQLPVSAAGSSMQQIQVPGSKFHYVRLVSPSTHTSVTKPLNTIAKLIPATRQIAPATSSQPSNQVKITLPVSQNLQLQSAKAGTVVGSQTMQRIILPAAPMSMQAVTTIATTTPTPTSLTPIRPNLHAAGTSNLTQLPPGTTLLTPSTTIPGLQGFALVPAQYVTQYYVGSNRGQTTYCDCFANGEFCHNCNCTNCANNLDHEEERSRAIKSCLDRNPTAFHPKIGKGKDNDGNRRHNKGCNCKRSGCLKNYCECYEAKIMCSSFCKCIGCKNFEESSERKTLMHLADAAEVRVQQQTAAKSKLSSQISGIPSKPPVSSASGERLPFTLITADVAEATSACLLAQAEEAERLKMPPVVQERMVIEEFGRCLMQIIESANKTRGDQT
ncbi:hypothetical protein C0Q70_01135 [Pomacea canaliculata]|uniref:CRC domain-containing protein n=1 Tax=Pomacea canaliculata TaxID=400727 RepID=A0A2T7PYP3_POMCA|nr:hypothetical protein C0Q70_01135 [Pomacea canaliculata]